MRHPQHQKSDVATLLTAIGKLWIAGVDVDWKAGWADESRRRVPLPTYPFERKRYWVDFRNDTGSTITAPPEKKKDVADWFYTDSWTRRELPPASDESRAESWLILDDTLGIASRLAQRLRAAVTEPIPQSRIVSFHGLGASEAEWTALLQRIEGMDGGELVLVTRGMHEVIGGEALDPYNAAFVDLVCRAAARAGVRCRTIDVIPNDVNRLAEQLFAELAHHTAAADIALRGPFRWMHAYGPVRLAPAAPKRGGHYVIVGDPDAALLVEQSLSRLEPVSVRVLATEDEEAQNIEWLIYAPSAVSEPAEQLREAVELSSLVDRLQPANVMTFARGAISRYVETLGRMKNWCALRVTADVPVEEIPELLHRSMVFGRSVVACPMDLNEVLRRGEIEPIADERPALKETSAVPVHDLEATLRAIWQEQLGIERIASNDNFFELGGTSLNGIQIVAAARRKGLHFTSKQLFEHQTVANLLAVVTRVSATAATAAPLDSTPRENVTPSDFRKVQLSQAELDDIMANLVDNVGEEALADV